MYKLYIYIHVTQNVYFIKQIWSKANKFPASVYSAPVTAAVAKRLLWRPVVAAVAVGGTSGEKDVCPFPG